MFNVNGEALLLPDVPSVLNFDADSDFPASTDPVVLEKFRTSRFWGRLYLDGWPTPVQYLRAHVGDAPPKGRHRFVLAEPSHACQPLTNQNLGEQPSPYRVPHEDVSFRFPGLHIDLLAEPRPNLC